MPNGMETDMSIVKVIELIAESPNSWEEAASTAIETASKSVHGIKSMYIKEFEAKVEENKVVGYRVIAKVSFVLD
jgi:flavin-binding protein dodecin